jgi:hypothetical protein
MICEALRFTARRNALALAVHETSASKRRSTMPGTRGAYAPASATASISTRPPNGRPATCTVERAGGAALKAAP